MQTEYFDCECNSPEHTIRFVYDDSNKENDEVYIEVQMNPYLNIFKRFWVAFKYIFGIKEQGNHWDCFILKKERCRQIN